jgi:DNA-binding LacI/PurR family transcriptional regulator
VFLRDIAFGRFSADAPLPPAKELCALYGVCAATVRKVLSSMVAEGTLIRSQRSYLLPPRQGGRYRRLVFISQRTGPTATSIFNPRAQRFTEVLEYECARLHTAITVADYDMQNPANDRRVMAAVSGRGEVLGCVLNLPWIETEAAVEKFSSTVSSLSRVKHTVAVIDESGIFPPPPEARVRVFRIAGRSAGRAVGRLLLSSGHRRIAYLSHLHDFRWSQERLAGLIDAFGDAGFHDGVVPFTFMAAGSTDNVPVWLRAGASGSGERGAAFAREVAALEPVVERDLSPLLAAAVRHAAYSAIELEMDTWMLHSWFDRALASGATAWVLANDGAAINAMKYLHSKGRVVPDDVALVGFDNTPEAFEQRVTTVDFNMRGLACAVLDFLLRPPDTPRPAEEMPCVIMERESTRKAASTAQ